MVHQIQIYLLLLCASVMSALPAPPVDASVPRKGDLCERMTPHPHLGVALFPRAIPSHATFCMRNDHDRG